MSMVVYFIMKALLAVVRVFPVFSLMIAHCVFFFSPFIDFCDPLGQLFINTCNSKVGDHIY